MSTTIRRLRRTLRKRKGLLGHLWRDLSSLFDKPAPRAAATPRPAPHLSAPAPTPPPPPASAPAVARRRTTRRKRIEAVVEETPSVLPSGKRILMIDDDATFLELIQRLLRAYDCVVETAVGADMGLAAARRRPPDVIVIDYHMPEANGFEVIQRLRRDEALCGVPRIMMTGAGRAATLRETLQFDVTAVLVKPVVKSELVAALERALGGRLPEGQSKRDVTAPPGEISLEDLRRPAPVPARPAEETADAFEIKYSSSRVEPGAETAELVHDDAPAVKAVSAVIRQALVRNASDIHIEPLANGVQVRLRVDGELYNVATYPLALAPALAARVKVMASLDIAERRLPQDGRLAVEAGARRVDFRVSTLPSLFGEKVVMRVIGSTKIDGDLSKLGLPPSGMATLQWALGQPNGLILLTGPTGSGKTTTLYRMLAYLNDGKRNIVTIEDPIEGQLDGITQVAVHAEIGLTFEKALRAFLRQDPDVMLVGEIRDAETAEIAVRAALTGRLILSTLHTNDSISSVSRLVGMKVPAYMLAGSLRLVAAQRLVRLLCSKCRREEAPTPSERDALAAAGRPLERLFRPAGCSECGSTGYLGRAPVLELLAFRSAELRELVRVQAPGDAVRSLAVKEGSVPLARAALELVADGRTSFAEALRAASID